MDGAEVSIDIIEVPLKGKFDVGPFSELITSPSMPEPNALAVRTPLGTIFHTGDWKFDPDPVIGEVSDFEGLQALGDEGAGHHRGLYECICRRCL